MAVRAMKEGAAEFPAQTLPRRRPAGRHRHRPRPRPRLAGHGEERDPPQIRVPHRPREGGDRLRHQGRPQQTGRGQVGVTEMTVKVHRHNVMRRWGRLHPDLVRMMERLTP